MRLQWAGSPTSSGCPVVPFRADGATDYSAGMFRYPDLGLRLVSAIQNAWISGSESAGARLSAYHGHGGQSVSTALGTCVLSGTWVTDFSDHLRDTFPE